MPSTVIDMDVYFNEMISNEKLCLRQEELKESQISTIQNHIWNGKRALFSLGKEELFVFNYLAGSLVRD